MFLFSDGGSGEENLAFAALAKKADTIKLKSSGKLNKFISEIYMKSYIFLLSSSGLSRMYSKR